MPQGWREAWRRKEGSEKLLFATHIHQPSPSSHTHQAHGVSMISRHVRLCNHESTKWWLAQCDLVWSSSHDKHYFCTFLLYIRLIGLLHVGEKSGFSLKYYRTKCITTKHRSKHMLGGLWCCLLFNAVFITVWGFSYNCIHIITVWESLHEDKGVVPLQRELNSVIVHLKAPLNYRTIKSAVDLFWH